jgi:hypothetical protein
MLTDDDLIRELEAGFREETAGLRYAGRVPAPRRSAVPWSALPVAAVAAAIVLVPRVAAHDGPTAPEGAPSSQAVPATSTPTPTPKVVTQRIDLAAFQTAVQAAGNEWPILTWRMRGITVPADATPVAEVATPAQAWVGVDPETGFAALWVTTPTRNGGSTFVASGDNWTQEQLVHLLLTGER